MKGALVHSFSVKPVRRCATNVICASGAQDTKPVVKQAGFKAAIDFKFLRDNLETIESNCRNRNFKVDAPKIAAVYEEWTRLKAEADDLRRQRNDNSNAMKAKLEPEQRTALIEAGKKLKDQVAAAEERVAALEAELQSEGQRLPNLTHPAVPIGGEELATVLRMVGAQREFDFAFKNHVEVAEALDLVDFDAASDVSGSKFYYLKNAAALLEMALIQYTMNKLTIKYGFTPYMTPDLVRESVFEKCGFQPRADNTQVYSVKDSELCLTGTAEIPLGGLYMDQIIDESQLPIKMCAFGHCFRTEAGAAGAAGKGLYRVHQFSKVEMFVLSTPEQSDVLHDELLQIEEDLFAELGLHFKILDMPTQDLGAPAYRKFDVEAWMPGLNRYGEISSASNCTDYQARRLNIRYRPANKPKGTEFVHTLNATGCAVPRMLICILENYQQADGTVAVPKALQPYLGGMEVIRPPARRTVTRASQAPAGHAAGSGGKKAPAAKAGAAAK